MRAERHTGSCAGAQRSPRRLVWNGVLGGALTQTVAAVLIALFVALGVLFEIANGQTITADKAKDLIVSVLGAMTTPLLFGVPTGLVCGLAIKYRLSSLVWQSPQRWACTRSSPANWRRC